MCRSTCVCIFVNKHYSNVAFVCFFPHRYFPFLAKQKPGHPEYDILTNVFAILSAKNLSDATAGVVMDIVSDLLNIPDFEPTETVLSLPVAGCIYADVSEDMDGVYLYKGNGRETSEEHLPLKRKDHQYGSHNNLPVVSLAINADLHKLNFPCSCKNSDQLFFGSFHCPLGNDG